MADISSNSTHADQADLFTGILNDMTAMRAAILAVTAKLDTLGAKLNADAGVTDVDYAVNFAGTCNPAALVTVP